MPHRLDINEERFTISSSDGPELKFLTGIQALVLATIAQRMRDEKEGKRTGGFISGYRGSPLAPLDKWFELAGKIGILDRHNIVFHPGVNEDLAAASVWGTQQIGFFPRPRTDGVFGFWYGKGPGLDRSVDAMKHANAAGVSPLGGAIAVVGDDHNCKSSTMPHQSEHAFAHMYMPTLAPSSVQEVFDFMLYGWALSRYSGAWVGMKVVADLCDASSNIIADPYLPIAVPEHSVPGGVHIRSPDKALEQEKRVKGSRLMLAKEFANANRINALTHDIRGRPRLGIIAPGKSYQDVLQALLLLGIDDAKREALGIRIFRVGMPWPLAEGPQLWKFLAELPEVLVVEEKLGFVESALKEVCYGHATRPVIYGKKDRFGDELLPVTGELTSVKIAVAIARAIGPLRWDDAFSKRVLELDDLERSAHAQSLLSLERVPYFCSGCPHNTSTKIPAGSQALAGIGCHYMGSWMPKDGEESGSMRAELVSHMGGEGATWIGTSRFTETPHVFANLGDGTYHHSGLLAIRASVSAKTNITYKILYNDAVAMTGGQKIDGEISVESITQQVFHEGVRRIAVVSDEPEKYPDRMRFARGTTFHHRRELDRLEREFRETKGVSVLVYDQTCAAEKRRRRKKKQLETPSARIFINERVCEGCGDCSVASNCLSVEPVETFFGTKRHINQSSCNFDRSCLSGFCPSFVTIEGATPKKREIGKFSKEAIPDPEISPLRRIWNIVLMGVGGTGVLTVEQILATAASRAGLSASGLSMTGMSQKYGAVSSHVRIAPGMIDIPVARTPWGEADLLLGCDMLVSSTPECLAYLRKGVSHAVVNDHAAPTPEMAKKHGVKFPKETLIRAITGGVGEGRAHFFDATAYAQEIWGDAIGANMFLVGVAYQRGLIPIPHDAIEEAVKLNGVDTEMNIEAFAAGRFATAFPDLFASIDWEWRMTERERTTPESMDRIIERYRFELMDYQDARYEDRWLRLVRRVEDLDSATSGRFDGDLTRAAASSFFKLMAYKDEYEVARLYMHRDYQKRIEREFEGRGKMTYHMAPPIFAKKDPSTGLPMKRKFGPWMGAVLALLAKGKFLRGSMFDPFGWTHERRAERALIGWYESLMNDALPLLSGATYGKIVELAKIPETILGYGHVKEAAIVRAKARAKELLLEIRKIKDQSGKTATLKGIPIVGR